MILLLKSPSDQRPWRRRGRCKEPQGLGSEGWGSTSAPIFSHPRAVGTSEWFPRVDEAPY